MTELRPARGARLNRDTRLPIMDILGKCNEIATYQVHVKSARELSGKTNSMQEKTRWKMQMDWVPGFRPDSLTRHLEIEAPYHAYMTKVENLSSSLIDS